MEGNPNEIVLIPMLNKRMTDLTMTNVLLEAKLEWAEREKSEMLAEMGGKTQRILDLEHTQAASTESAVSAAKTEWETERAKILAKFDAERQEIRNQAEERLKFHAEDIKRACRADIDAANARLAEAVAENQALKTRISELESSFAEMKTTRKRTKKEPTVIGGDTY